MLIKTMTCIRLLLRKLSTCRNLKFASIQKNRTNERILIEDVALTDDGKTVVAWHPKSDFSYEYSGPLPKAEEVSNLSLVEERINNAIMAFKNNYPEIARQELMNLTHTTKHRWFPRSRDKRAKKTQMDRPYL